jgi:hypothetical protein
MGMKGLPALLIILGTGLLPVYDALGTEMTLVRFPSRELELLAGPLTPIGVPKSAKMYDALQLTQGRIYAEGFPPPGIDSIASANFYDLALTLYQIYYRTGDPYWLTRARRVAIAWRDSDNLAAVEKLNADEIRSYEGGALSGRIMSTLGLAILAVESNDTRARKLVNEQCLFQFWSVGKSALGYFDQRETGYTLMAFVAATILGYDQATNARRQLDIVLAAQRPDGRWATGIWPTNIGPDSPLTMNYMTGILMEALILYDRAIGDQRILPAILKGLQWLWNTQWVSAAQAFQYTNTASDGTYPVAVLNGLLLPAWGYAYYKTGDPKYREQGNQILRRLVETGGNEIHGSKQFAQMFRSSSRYLGYIALKDSMAPKGRTQ